MTDVFNQNPNQAARIEAFKKERFNRSNDEIRVHNPTNEDYLMDYDGNAWIFPNQQKDTGYGPGDRVVPRYIAGRYIEEMLTVLIRRESDDILAKEKKNYKGDWWAGYEEQKALRTDNRELRAKYLPQLYRGIENRYGDELDTSSIGKVDARPIEEVLMEQIDRERSQKAALQQIGEENATEDTL